MKSAKNLTHLLLLLFSTLLTAQSATISWDGGAGTFSWQDATNWSGDVLPSTLDDVEIDVPGDVTITSSASVTIRSLQCSNHLALTAGTFRVTSGSSVVQGQFTGSGSSVLSATGAATTFTLPNATNVNGASFEATSGAQVSLPNVTEFSKGSGCFGVAWIAESGGTISFPQLNILTGAECAALTIRASTGGVFSLTNLVTVTEGTINFLADGAGSEIQLPSLQQSLANLRYVHFEARDSGSIEMPLLLGGKRIRIILDATGNLPVAQLTELAGFTVSGRALSFPALTNLTLGEVTVSGGATVSTPSLTQHHETAGCMTSVWLVTGTGSSWDLSNVTSVTGPTCGFWHVRATAGGSVDLSGLTSVSEGTLTFLADGTNSLLNLNALAQSAGTIRTVALEARNAGTILLPLLTGGTNVTVTVESDGVLPTHQFRKLRGFTVTDMTADFPALTNLTPGSITVNGGAIVNVPSLTRHSVDSGCAGLLWLVSGAGSLLNFSGLTNFSGPDCGFLTLQATAGGTLLMTNLAALTEGTLTFVADGAGSLVDLTALVESIATSRGIGFEARNGGTIALPEMQGGSTVTVTIESGGQVEIEQMNQLKGLNVSGASVTLPAITNLFGGSITAENGAVLSFPNWFRHNQGSGCVVNQWIATGAGSRIDLTSLTNLVGSSCGSLSIQALAGGEVALDNLPVIDEGELFFLADGPGSMIDLGSLTQSLALVKAISFEARNAGTIDMPQMPGGPTVGVTLRTAGILPTAQLRQLNRIGVYSVDLTFSSLTNFDSGTIFVTNATVSAPNLTSYDRASCASAFWQVTGPGSVLELGGITQITGSTCANLDAQALNGGHLLLGNLTNIGSGAVFVTASGSGSLVDLHSLRTFLNATANSSLNATNGGTILLPEEPLLLSGVTTAFAEGTPGLPALSLAGTHLILHAQPWHSYWVEQRNSLSATNPWSLFARVPLTNAFQPIAPLVGANTALRAWEFVADPYLLDISLTDSSNVQLVLYAPTNRLLELQSVTNLVPAGPWETNTVVGMTNTFRILPGQTITPPQRFFRAVTL